MSDHLIRDPEGRHIEMQEHPEPQIYKLLLQF